MATTDALNERIAAAIKKILLEEYPHMKNSSANSVAHAGAGTVARKYRTVAKEDIRGIRSLHFTDLPRELRDRVYHYAVVQHRPISIALTEKQCSAYDTLPGVSNSSTYGLPKQSSITRVSKWMREESLKVFYKNNKFVASLEYASRSWSPEFNFGFKLGDSLCLLTKWLRSRGPTNVNNIDNLLLLRFENGDGTAAQTRNGVEASEGVKLPKNTEEVVISNLQVQAMWQKLWDGGGENSLDF